MRSHLFAWDGPIGHPQTHQGGRRVYFDPVSGLVAGAGILGGVMSSRSQAKAGEAAANAQTASAQAGIAEQQRQFDAVQKLLAPYVQAGTGALGAQQNLLGINGAEAQQAAIQGLQNSPAFQSQLHLGENRLLQNASATGGLRGGNTQAALGQFAPGLLAQMIQQQYGNLGGLTSIGQNAAAGVGNAGMQTGQNVATLLGQQGAAQAGAALNSGRAQQNMYNSFTGALGQYMGGRGGAPSAPSGFFGISSPGAAADPYAVGIYGP